MTVCNNGTGDAPARPYIVKKRKSLRLKGYDYTQVGVYFISICTINRECLFGEIVGGRMQLNQFGRIVREE